MPAAHRIKGPRGVPREGRCPSSGEARARVDATPRSARTGLEPFLAASAIGLVLWALLLAPFLL